MAEVESIRFPDVFGMEKIKGKRESRMILRLAFEQCGRIWC